MTVTEAKILTAETIPKYLESHLSSLKGVIDSLDGIEVAPIAG